MKKILLSIVMLVFTTAAFSQECFQIESGTRIIPQAGAGPGVYQLIINYSTNGSKALAVVVQCDGTPLTISPACDTYNNTAGTIVYSNLFCQSGNIIAILTRYTGSCGANNRCGNDTTIFGGNSGGPLPVKLNEFTAVRSKQNVTINWSTEFETDAKEFIIERAEGNDFRSVGTISSNGNSTVKRSYSYNDKNDNAGVTYYRLKNVDLNGRFTYSAVKSVKGIGAADDVTVFPNPARANSKISVVGASANSSIQLVDFSGKILRNINSNTINSFDLNGVQNGTYLIRITNKTTNEVVNKKLTVSN